MRSVSFSHRHTLYSSNSFISIFHLSITCIQTFSNRHSIKLGDEAPAALADDTIILSSSICNPQNPCSIFQLDKQSSRLSPTMMKLMTMLMLMTMVMPMALLTLLFPPWRLLLPPLLLHLPPLLWFVYMFYFEQCFIQLYLFIYLL